MLKILFSSKDKRLDFQFIQASRLRPSAKAGYHTALRVILKVLRRFHVNVQSPVGDLFKDHCSKKYTDKNSTIHESALNL